MNKLNDGLYHTEIGLPVPEALLRPGIIYPEYTKHALLASMDDRYLNKINLPKRVDLRAAKVIEVEVKGGRVSKVLYRVRYSSDLDLVLAIGAGAVVRTVWLNKKSDKHKTLNRKLYRSL